MEQDLVVWEREIDREKCLTYIDDCLVGGQLSGLFNFNLLNGPKCIIDSQLHFRPVMNQTSRSGLGQIRRAKLQADIHVYKWSLNKGLQ